MNENRLITYRSLHDDRKNQDYIRRKLQVAFDQVDRGDVSDLDMNALRAESHRRHAARHNEHQP